MDPAEAIAQLLREMSKGQHLILVRAIEDAGGQVRIDWNALVAASDEASPKIEVDGEDGAILLRLVGGG